MSVLGREHGDEVGTVIDMSHRATRQTRTGDPSASAQGPSRGNPRRGDIDPQTMALLQNDFLNRMASNQASSPPGPVLREPVLGSVSPYPDETHEEQGFVEQQPSARPAGSRYQVITPGAREAIGPPLQSATFYYESDNEDAIDPIPAYYHRVIKQGSGLFLVYDRRYVAGRPWFPRGGRPPTGLSRGGGRRPLVVAIHGQGQVGDRWFSVLPTDLRFEIDGKEICILLLRGEVAPSVGYQPFEDQTPQEDFGGAAREETVRGEARGHQAGPDTTRNTNGVENGR